VPQHNLFRRPAPGGVEIAPGAGGGASWSPVSYDPRTGLVYVAALHLPTRYTVKEIPAAAGAPAVRYTALEPVGGATWGTLSAIDTRARGKIAWQVTTAQPLVGACWPPPATSCSWARQRGLQRLPRPDRRAALAVQLRRRGERPPVTYELDGRQYVAVAAGGSAIFGYRQGDAIVAFCSRLITAPPRAKSQRS